MSKIFRMLFTVLLVLLLSGCVVPYSGDYYHPSASEGRVGGYGDWYAPSTLYLSRGGNVQIDIIGYWAIKLSGQRQAVAIEIWIRPQAVLNVDVENIHILNDNSEKIAHLDSFRARNSDWTMQVPVVTDDVSLKGDVLPSKYWTVYSLYYVFDNPPPKQFYVQLPIMQTGNVSYPPLSIKFEKTHGQWWQPLM